MRKLVLCLVLVAGCQESITDMSSRLDRVEAKAQASLDAYNLENKLSIAYGFKGDKIREAVALEQAARAKAEYEAAEQEYKALKARLLQRVESGRQ